MREPPTEQLLHILAAWAARIGGGMIFLIAVLVCGDVFTRNVLNRIVFHSFELGNYLFAIAAAFGMAYALLARAHIRIDVAYNKFPAPMRRMVDLLALLTTTAVACLFAYKAWVLALGALARGVKTNSTLGIEIGYPQAAWALGLSFFALVGLVLTLRHIRLLIAGQTVRADALAGIGSEIPGNSGQEAPAEAKVAS